MRSRPLNIVAYAADQTGCGYHRIIVPANLLASQGGAKVSVEPLAQDVEWHKASKPDVIVFQRQFEVYQIEKMCEIREALPKAFLVYEIDDLLSEVPERNFHSSFIAKDIGSRIIEAINICDRVVVTTEELAKWVKENAKPTDVRVVPNYIAQSFIRERPEPVDKKLIRVGWAGGVSHTGDLELLSHALKHVIGVQWVFFGMKPEMELPDNVEFHEFVPINMYNDKLASLNIDLFLAPLEDCRFNECKSDLKLIEAGAVGAAVIATPTQPYKEFKPPVFAYAETPADWTAAITAYCKLSYSQRKHHGKQMQNWVRTKRTYEANLLERNTAWLPANDDLWVPTQEDIRARPLHVVTNEREVPNGVAYSSLECACEDAIHNNADVLWMRLGTSITQSGIAKLRVTLLDDRFTATVSPLASDGYNAFPRINQMTPVEARQAEVIHNIAVEAAKDQRGYLMAFSGPCLLIRNQGLRTLGAPDVASYGGDAELALVDWTAKATESGLRNIQVFDVYAGTTQAQKQLNADELKRLEARDVLRYIKATPTPLADNIREIIELRYHANEFRGINQGMGGLPNDYPTWAALKVDPVPKSDGSKVAVIYSSQVEDADIDFEVTPYVLTCLDGTILQPFAKGLIQDAFEAGAGFVFGDHEEIDEQGNIQPCFKPGNDETLSKSSDFRLYIHCMNMGNDDKFPACGGVHIPHVLGRVKRFTKEQGLELSKNKKKFNSQYLPNSVNEINEHIPESGFVFYRPTTKLNRSLAVIIHVGEKEGNLLPCLTTLIKHTSHPISSIVLAIQDFGVSPPDIGDYANDPRVRTVSMKTNNVSQLLNFAASECDEDVLIFMTDEMRIVVPTWADSMMAYLEDDDVGSVGARIFHLGGFVTHAGVVISRGVPAVVHKGSPANSTGYFGAAVLSHEASAVSRECLAIRREVFTKFRFDKRFHTQCMDYDLGVRLMQNGYKNIVDCSAQIQSYASGFEPSEADYRDFQALHEDFIDPYLNPNFTLTSLSFDYSTLAINVKEPSPFRKRVLVINDAPSLHMMSHALVKESKEDNIVLRGIIDGFNLIMVAPTLENAPSFDMRDPVHLRDALNELHVNRIVMPSLVGAGAAPAVVESIKALMQTGIQFDYVGNVKAMICPRIDMTIDGQDCGSGWKNGVDHCQMCVNTNGSPFGLVDVRAWLATWDDYSTSKLSLAA